MPLEDDDWGLLRRSSTESSAFGVLFERHRDFVYRVACGLLARQDLAEDATQEVFLRLVQKSGELEPRARLRTVLYGFVVNVARELRRPQLREVDLERSPERSTPPPSPLKADVWRHLPSLPERQREVVVLRLFEGMSTREAAQALGCGEGAVKTHLHRATRTLRRALTPLEPRSDA